MITLKDLSEKLNVSVSTVSKALHDSPEISENTKKRIQKVAELYNYRPNKVALSLKNNATKTLGIIIPDILNPFFAKVLYGIEEEATKQNYNIITCITNESLKKEQSSIELLANGSVDGFIVAASQETLKADSVRHLHNVIMQDLPVVMFDRVVDTVNCDKIVIDDFDTAKTATQFLINKGKKNIALISTISNLNVGKARIKGYKQALQEHDIAVNDNSIIATTKTDAYATISSFLNDNHNSIDAVLAIDNISGIITTNIATSLGISIPEQLSVIGFTDPSSSNTSTPQLSVVNQRAEEIGKASVNLLIQRLKQKDSFGDYTTKVVSTTIVEQETT